MRILLIDDDEVFLTLMEGILSQKGYQVVRATDGKQAREALAVEKIDLIISDVYMPTLDGVRFHSFVREFTDAKNVPFIFISAHADKYLQNLATQSANDYFLRKPVPVEDILTLIDKVTTRITPGGSPGPD